MEQRKMIFGLMKKWSVVWVINLVCLVIFCILFRQVFYAALYELIFLAGVCFAVVRNRKPAVLQNENGQVIVKGVFRTFRIEQPRLISIKGRRDLLSRVFDWEMLVIATDAGIITMYVPYVR